VGCALRPLELTELGVELSEPLDDGGVARGRGPAGNRCLIRTEDLLVSSSLIGSRSGNAEGVLMIDVAAGQVMAIRWQSRTCRRTRRAVGEVPARSSCYASFDSGSRGTEPCVGQLAGGLRVLGRPYDQTPSGPCPTPSRLARVPSGMSPRSRVFGEALGFGARSPSHRVLCHRPERGEPPPLPPAATAVPDAAQRAAVASIGRIAVGRRLDEDAPRGSVAKQPLPPSVSRPPGRRQHTSSPIPGKSLTATMGRF